MDVMCRDFIKESQLPRDGVGNAPHCGKPSQGHRQSGAQQRGVHSVTLWWGQALSWMWDMSMVSNSGDCSVQHI